MLTLPFYKNPVPLDVAKHRHYGLNDSYRFGFADNVNAVPVNFVELPHVCQSYPIAFSPNKDAPPVAILGLRNNENLFVDGDGNWMADTYIPACIRRYPFVFLDSPDEEQLTLCVDEEVLVEKGETRLFEVGGEPSKLTQQALEFCKSFRAAARETKAFGQSLESSGILVKQEAIAETDNRRITFRGFRVVDEQKLVEMEEDVFLEWRRRGWLPALYAHLFSTFHWARLNDLLHKRLEAEGE